MMRNYITKIITKDEDTGEVIYKNQSNDTEEIREDISRIEEKIDMKEIEIEHDIDDMIVDKAEQIKKRRKLERKLNKK